MEEDEIIQITPKGIKVIKNEITRRIISVTSICISLVSIIISTVIILKQL